jgi:hypothetical protein
MKYEVTINCVAVETVEAASPQEAEKIVREEARVGDCDILWVGVERLYEDASAVQEQA